MTFDEFFKKKKINLAAFETADPGLFLEFRNHFELMGEKSFDHTKKYWFNKLRHLYPAPAEIKQEKVLIENQLTEQTITEELALPAEPPAPKVGFKPRFKAAALPKPNPATETQQAESKEELISPVAENESTPGPNEQAAPDAPSTEETPVKPAYKPRFNARNLKPKDGD
jgi:hypothetical protein